MTNYETLQQMEGRGGENIERKEYEKEKHSIIMKLRTCNMMSVLDLMEVHWQAGWVYHCFDSDEILSILWNGNWK